MIEKAILTQVKERLESANHILVVSHIRPDGDAIGSLLGMGLSLQALGKEVHMVLDGKIPYNFRALPEWEQILMDSDELFDLIIVVDCSDLERTGRSLDDYGQIDINIDHHVTNQNFAAINIVDPDAVSTTEIITDLLSEFNFPIDKNIATSLLAGLITDTLGFRTQKMTSKALRTAAFLMDYGVNLSELYRKTLLTRTYPGMRYWGAGLSNLKREDKLIWATLSLVDRKASNYTGRDDADLVNILSSVKESAIVVIFIEQTKGYVKVSWRSQPGYDVSQLAVEFGGGGHKPAAGAMIKGNLEEVQEKVLKSTRLVLNGIAK